MTVTQARLKEFRIKQADFNPGNAASSQMNLLAGLEGSRPRPAPSLTQLRSFMREDQRAGRPRQVKGGRPQPADRGRAAAPQPAPAARSRRSPSWTTSPCWPNATSP